MNTGTSTNEFVTIASFHNATGAYALKGLLLSEGVEARVQDETRLQRFWFAAAPKAGIHVQTTKSSFELAQKLIRQPEFAASLKSAIHCPSCDSLRVQYPDLTRKNLLPTLLGQLFVLLHITQHKYYCEDCHFTWAPGVMEGGKPRPSLSH